ncbi:MAG: porin [Pseudomonadota bacterium]
MISITAWTKVMCGMLVLSSLPVKASGLAATTTDSISYRSPSGDFRMKIGGRLHLDGAIFNEDATPMNDRAKVRRARLAADARFFKDWRLNAQYDLADTQERFRTLWLRYNGFDRAALTIGQFQEPFGLEEATSSNHIIFMERSLANALAPGTNVGLGLHRWGGRWAAQAGAFRETDIEDADPFAARAGYGFSGRVTGAPIDEKDRVLHIGLSASYRIPRASDRLRIRSKPESDVTDARLISTGYMRNVDQAQVFGLEGASAWGPLLAQGEYVQTRIQRYGDRPDETFNGGYLAASWVINGKPRHYARRIGAFGRVIPRSEAVWEVGVRRSMLDLNSRSGAITGGTEVNTTWAVNWYPNDQIRVMLNYIQVDTDAEAGDDDPSLLQMRVQWVI